MTVDDKVDPAQTRATDKTGLPDEVETRVGPYTATGNETYTVSVSFQDKNGNPGSYVFAYYPA